MLTVNVVVGKGVVGVSRLRCGWLQHQGYSVKRSATILGFVASNMACSSHH